MHEQKPMETHLIPVQDKFIIYRPLLKLAFIGNRAMADLALQVADTQAGGKLQGPPEALAFLRSTGFTAPDPTPPPTLDPQAAFHPTSAALLMTGRCNLRCIYCYAHGGEKGGPDLPLPAATAVIDAVCANALALGQADFEVTFHGGGEPTLAWETLKAAAAYARRCKLPARLNLVSNGVWNQPQREWVVGNLDGLTISMDGGRETQDRQRPFPSGKGSFEAVMQTLGFLEQVRFGYGIRVTATPERFAELPADVDFFCRKTGCQSIHIEPAFASQRGAHHAPDPAQAQAFSEAFLAAYDIAHAAGRTLFYSGARPWLLSNSFCTAPLGGGLTVNPGGEIVACYEITDRDHPLAEASTFGRWGSDPVTLQVDENARRAFVQRIADRRAVCRDCFAYWHCAGDCYTRAFPVENALPGQPYARCAVNQAITAGLLLRYIAEGGGVYRGPAIDPGNYREIQIPIQ